jgi:xylan 1,4-beta-xylosidase
VFRLFAKLGEDKLAVSNAAQVPLETLMASGVQGQADVGSIATRTADGKIALLLWHYHDDDVAGPDAQVRVALNGMRRAPANATVWRVDGEHANAFTAWKKMGSPQSPNQDQYAQLEAASQMKSESMRVTRASGGAGLDIRVPRQGVALVVLDAS